MNTPETPDIPETLFSFPCDFPLKIIARQAENIDVFIVTTLNKYLSKPLDIALTPKLSAQGNYQSFTVHIWAESEAQLKAIHEDLRENPAIIMVL